MEGWLLSRVTGNPRAGWRPARSPRKGERCEYVMPERPEWGKPCLIAYRSDRPHPRGHLADHGRLGGPPSDALKAAARELGVSEAGSARNLLRRVGRAINPTFDPDVHLGTSKAPPTGSVGEDTFTDEGEPTLPEHTADTGQAWEGGADNIDSAPVLKSGVLLQSDGPRSNWQLKAEMPSVGYDVACDGLLYDNNYSSRLRLLARADLANDTNYVFVVYGGDYRWADTGDPLFRIYKRIRSEYTLLAEVTKEIELPATLKLQGSVRNAAKKFYLAEEEILSTSDNQIKLANFPGIAPFNFDEQALEKGLNADNWSATDAGEGEEAEGTAPENTEAPEISTFNNPVAVGETVYLRDEGTWTEEPHYFTYQWQRSPTGEGEWTNIAGATSDRYTLVEADAGEHVRCLVTAHNEIGSGEAGSNVLGPVEGLEQQFTLPVATETDTSLTQALAKAFSLSVASETDTAAVPPLSKLLGLPTATETDTLVNTAFAKALSLPVASEQAQAQALTLSKVIALGIAAETDTALAATALKRVALPTATETDVAVALVLIAAAAPAVLVLDDEPQTHLDLSEASP